MSHYGILARIGGVPCGMILRDAAQNGRYQAVFERELASLEEIEAINWTAPEIEAVQGAQVLPEGYGFEVIRITYDSNLRTYTVALQTAKQYLGDVTGYQAQVEVLAGQTAAARAETETVRQAAAEQEAALSRQAEAARTELETVQEAAAKREKELSALAEESQAEAEALRRNIQEQDAAMTAAYREGVESNG